MANDVESDAPKVQTLSPEELNEKIIYQIEFYFGDYNLPKDKFMQSKIKEDDGWVELDTLLTFNRLKSLTTDKEVITAAVKTSTNNIVEVSEDNTKIRRNPERPLPESFKQEFLCRTVYAKGFPKDATLDQLIEFFKPFNAGCVKMRKFSFNRNFKGSVFVMFETEELAKTFKETPDLKYDDVALITMMAREHTEKKAEERKNRKPKDKESKKEDQDEPNDLDDMARAEDAFQKMEKKVGVFLRLTGIPKDSDVSFGDIKKTFIDAELSVGYVEFKSGDEEATVRFTEEGAAKQAFEKLVKEGKLKIKEQDLDARVLEGDEETAFYRTLAEQKIQRFNNDRNNRKRAGQNREHGYYRGKGGRGGRGGHRGGRGGFKRSSNSRGEGNGESKRAKPDA